MTAGDAELEENKENKDKNSVKMPIENIFLFFYFYLPLCRCKVR